MSSTHEITRETPLDRLVAALVDWGATASQIVSHMELSRSVHAKKSSRDRAADLVARVDARVRDEIYLVPLPRPPARQRAPHRRARG